MKVNKLKKEWELFRNGKMIYKTKNEEEFWKYLDDYKHSLYIDGYVFLKEMTGCYSIFVKHKTQDVAYIAYREWYGLKDMNGKKIYHGDSLRNKDGYSVDIFTPYEGDNPLLQDDGKFKYRINDRWKKKVVTEDTNFIKEEGVYVSKGVFEMNY